METLVDIGDRDSAEEVAASLTKSSERNDVLTTVARAWIRAGDLDRASTVADHVADPVARAEVLTPVVDALVEAGDLRRAEELANSFADPAARILTLTRWNAQLAMLAKTAPDALISAIAELAVIARCGTGPADMTSAADRCLI